MLQQLPPGLPVVGFQRLKGSIRGYGFDGVEVAYGTVESSFGDSECGCKAPAKFTIYPNFVKADEQ
jgi:hypothetical protein